MLTPDEIDGFRVATSRIIDPVVEYLLKDIARRVREAGQLTSTAAYEAWRLEWMGMGKREMEKELARLLGISRNKAKKLLRQAAKQGYDLTRAQFPHAPAFEENAGLQQIVSAAVELAGEELQNITRTEAIGMMSPDGKLVPLAEAYHKCCDFAFKQVITGATDYNTAIRQACAGIVKHGVQVTYESGVHTTMEAAVRRNIMGGLGLMTEKIEQANHDALGCDGWEISAHANSAPDHEPIQGRQYPDAAYTALNNSLVRRIGTLNCGHIAFPIIIAVNTPQYTEEELRKFREDNARGVTYGGRHYTGYEATQKQREIERAIRAQKRRVILASPDEKETAAIKLNVLNQEYRRFSNGVGLRTEDERLHVSGFGSQEVATVRRTIEKYSKLHYNKDGTIVVTDDWKSKGKVSPPRVYRPNAVIETKTEYKNGTSQVDRTIYDEAGIMRTQIHSGPHNRPDQHKFGKKGEHVHQYYWNDDGTRKDRIDRELNDTERIEHADILGEED